MLNKRDALFSTANFWVQMNAKPAPPLIRLSASGFYGLLQDTGYFTKLAAAGLDPSTQSASAKAGRYSLGKLLNVDSAKTDLSRSEVKSARSSLFRVESVVERLNVLNLVTARRIALRLAITISADGSKVVFDTHGTFFDGLKVAGIRCVPHVLPKFEISFGAVSRSARTALVAQAEKPSESVSVELNDIVEDVKGWPGNLPSSPSGFNIPQSVSLVDYFYYGNERRNGPNIDFTVLPLELVRVSLGVIYFATLSEGMQASSRKKPIAEFATLPQGAGRPAAAGDSAGSSLIKCGISGSGLSISCGRSQQNATGDGFNPNKP